jgi:Nickel responsive protein SCO4226-like
MPKFIIERTVPGASRLTDAEIREASLKSLEALQTLGPEIQWIHSFITDDKIYCIYFSPDETLILEHAKLAGLPVDRVEAVRRLVDPANYQGQASRVVTA